MQIAFVSVCPQCGAKVKIRDTIVGKQIRCPRCSKAFIADSVQTSANESAAVTAAETLVKETRSSHASVIAPKSTPSPKPAAVEKQTSLGKLGRFQLRAILGQGAFGRVFRAYDPQLDRELALKVPTFASDDQRRVKRFLSEAKAAANLRHPHIVTVYESGEADGKYFIAAQFVAGETLGKRIESGVTDFHQIARWTAALAEALAYAHAESIVHRDIKPDNIMLDPRDEPQIMDFGLARRTNEESTQTIDGSVLGTPAYMAPEQAHGDQSKVGPHSDQYSLGVVLYELLTGQRPFNGPPHAVMAKVMTEEPPPLRSLRPDVPRDLEAICQKSMSKEASGRYASCREFAADLAAYLRGDGVSVRPQSWFERSKRWARRNPAVAGLASATLALILCIVGGLTLFSYQLSQKQTALAAALADAEDKKRIAEELAKKEQAALASAEEALQAREAALEDLKEEIDRRNVAESAGAAANRKRQEAEAKVDVATTATKELEKQKQEEESAKQVVQAKLAAEEKLRIEAEAAAKYGEQGRRIAQITRHLRNKEPKQAAALLAEIPEEHRRWEWTFLSALAADLPPRSIQVSSSAGLHFNDEETWAAYITKNRALAVRDLIDDERIPSPLVAGQFPSNLFWQNDDLIVLSSAGPLEFNSKTRKFAPLTVGQTAGAPIGWWGACDPFLWNFTRSNGVSRLTTYARVNESGYKRTNVPIFTTYQRANPVAFSEHGKFLVVTTTENSARGATVVFKAYEMPGGKEFPLEWTPSSLSLENAIEGGDVILGFGSPADSAVTFVAKSGRYVSLAAIDGKPGDMNLERHLPWLARQGIAGLAPDGTRRISMNKVLDLNTNEVVMQFADLGPDFAGIVNLSPGGRWLTRNESLLDLQPGRKK